MILKCLDGPMDGVVYVLSKNTAEPSERSTNRKPDGLWFSAEEDGYIVQHQYAFDRLADQATHLVMCYRYSGPVVESEIEMTTGPEQVEGWDVHAGFAPGLPKTKAAKAPASDKIYDPYADLINANRKACGECERLWRLRITPRHCGSSRRRIPTIRCIANRGAVGHRRCDRSLPSW